MNGWMDEGMEGGKTDKSTTWKDNLQRYSPLKEVEHNSPLLKSGLHKSGFLPKSTVWKGGVESNFIVEQPNRSSPRRSRSTLTIINHVDGMCPRFQCEENGTLSLWSFSPKPIIPV